MATIAGLTLVAAIDSWNPVLLSIFAATAFVFTKSAGFFLNWKKDFKNVFDDQ